MKIECKVPIGTKYKPKQQHVTLEGAMIQAAYIGKGLGATNERKMKVCTIICAAISLFIVVAILGVIGS